MQTTETIRKVKVEAGIASGFNLLCLLLPGHTRIKINNPSVIETLNYVIVLFLIMYQNIFERKYSLHLVI